MAKRVVITYGTYDLFHEGHRRLLERAKELGDYLIVGVTTDGYDSYRGKLNVKQDVMQRIENVKKSGFADKVIIEEYEGQKVEDIQRYGVDVFAIGSDWEGKFDYLNEYCEVIYLERTKGISSTQLRNKSHGVLRIGIVGAGRIANRFVAEARFVSGVNVEGVFGRTEEKLKVFTDEHDLSFWTTDYSEFLSKVDAVYVASPHLSHYQYAKDAIEAKKHVLCEKPLVLSKSEAVELFKLAEKKKVVLLEAIKTAYAPGFIRMVAIAKSGLIGDIVAVDASFTKLENPDFREFSSEQAGGSVTELASYPLLAAAKLLGTSPSNISFDSYFGDEVDLFTRINLRYKGATASLKVGLGVKSEGDLVISGTKGYIYAASPWWKTERFEIKYENMSENKPYSYKFAGDGLRYEIAELVTMINGDRRSTHKLSERDSVFITRVIEEYLNGNNVNRINE